MTLKQWLDSQGKGAEWLADQLGVTPPCVWKWLRKNRVPKSEMRIRITQLSGGKVVFNEAHKYDHPIYLWIVSSGMNVSSFALKHGISHSVIYSWIKGRTNPTRYYQRMLKDLGYIAPEGDKHGKQV